MSLKSKLKEGGYSIWKGIIFEGSRPVGLKKGKSVDVRYYDLSNVEPSAKLADYCEENGIEYREVLVGRKPAVEEFTAAIEKAGYGEKTRILNFDTGKR